jgi:hypothetical protein
MLATVKENLVNFEPIRLEFNPFPSDLDPDKVYDWARATKILVKYKSGVPEQHFPALLNALLPCPRARTFALHQLERDPHISFLQMVDYLQFYFGHSDPAAAAAKSMQHLKQEEGEDFYSYFHQASTIFERVPDISAGEKLRTLVSGLNKTYLYHLQSNELVLRQLNPAHTPSYQETVDFLKQLDPLFGKGKSKSKSVKKAKTVSSDEKQNVRFFNRHGKLSNSDIVLLAIHVVGILGFIIGSRRK